MDKPHFTQQTSVTLPVHAPARDAPGPKALGRHKFDGALQWLLEGPGWSVLRPSVDFVLLCVAVRLRPGWRACDHARCCSRSAAGLPPLVMLLLYLRGLYRTRLRALLLDGVAPV